MSSITWALLLLFSVGVFPLLLILEELMVAVSVSLEVAQDFDLSITLDKEGSIFLSMVTSVSAAVFFYSTWYMRGVEGVKKFIWTLLLFSLSMALLSISGDLFTLMVGWDGLGLTSFCLIIYYSSWVSVKGGVTTLMTNRLGDISLIFSISLSVMSNGAASAPLYLSVLVLLGALTKSAQVPFSAWLPLAMAAPTPVSSLVHSSTLVTAGIFLVSRFSQKFSSSSLFLLFLVSSSSILLSGISALSEFDLKKVIALSTLSHISLMMLFLSVGSRESALFHMLLHAYFKSLLFMAAGKIIHESNGWQDIRVLRMSSFSFDVRFSLLISLISMGGAPFLSGFFSKELFLMVSSSSGVVFLLCLFYVSAILTVAYSVRLLFFLLNFPTLPLWGGGGGVFLPLWSVLSSAGSVFFSSFFPFSEGGCLSPFSGSLPLIFLLGVCLGANSSVSPSLKGGGMWGLHPFSVFGVKGVRLTSHHLSGVLDLMGWSSKGVPVVNSGFSFWVPKSLPYSAWILGLVVVSFLTIF